MSHIARSTEKPRQVKVSMRTKIILSVNDNLFDLYGGDSHLGHLSQTEMCPLFYCLCRADDIIEIVIRDYHQRIEDRPFFDIFFILGA